MAAGILFRKQNYPRMQAKISAGNDCPRFPQVTGGNLLAPAGNLGEAFIVRVRADFLKPKDVSSCSTIYFGRSNHLLPLKSMVKPSNLILFEKSWTVHCWLFNPLSKILHSKEKFFTMIGNWVLSLLTSFTILE